MQYSKDGAEWREITGDFVRNMDRTAKLLGIKRGELIYWRENESSKVYSDLYGRKYGR